MHIIIISSSSANERNDWLLYMYITNFAWQKSAPIYLHTLLVRRRAYLHTHDERYNTEEEGFVFSRFGHFPRSEEVSLSWRLLPSQALSTSASCVNQSSISHITHRPHQEWFKYDANLLIRRNLILCQGLRTLHMQQGVNTTCCQL